MLEVLSEKKLSTGENLRILRLITPADFVPERVKRYMIASLGYDTYRNAVNELNYWRLYFRAVFDGEGAVDHLYLAEVDGELAARVWFAYSRRSGYGNFGNVYTEPEFRRRGLMNELMAPCLNDFSNSPAKMICCSSGNKIAVNSYLKDGFHLIYDGETGPLCLLKPEYGKHFGEVETAAFDGSPVGNIRCGTIDDQYDCDKFLFYTRPLRSQSFRRIGPASFVTDYRTAFQEVRCGHGAVTVAENRTGTIVAYAFALKCFGQNCLDFTVHPDNASDVPALLEFTAGQFREQYPGEPLFISIASQNTLQLEIMKNIGCRKLAEFSGTVIFAYFD